MLLSLLLYISIIIIQLSYKLCMLLMQYSHIRLHLIILLYKPITLLFLMEYITIKLQVDTFFMLTII